MLMEWHEVSLFWERKRNVLQSFSPPGAAVWGTEDKRGLSPKIPLLDRLPQCEPNHPCSCLVKCTAPEGFPTWKRILWKQMNLRFFLFSIQVIVLDTCTLRTVPSILWSDSYQCFVGCTLGKQQNKTLLNISTFDLILLIMWSFSHFFFIEHVKVI